MRKITLAICFFVLSPYALALGMSIKSDVKIGVGPAVSQIVAVNHFINNVTGNKAKTIIEAIDNPCAFTYSTLTIESDDFFFLKILIGNILGQRGVITLKTSDQEPPFAVQTNIDGSMSVNAIPFMLLAGIEWQARDDLTLLFAPGFFHVRTKRSINFVESSDMNARTESHYNASGFQVGGIVKTGERSSCKVAYSFFLGPISAHLLRVNDGTITHFFTPLLMFNSLDLHFNYQVTEDFSLFALASLSVAQNIKKVSVKAPESSSAFVSKQVITLFRSQLASLIIGAEWKF